MTIRSCWARKFLQRLPTVALFIVLFAIIPNIPNIVLAEHETIEAGKFKFDYASKKSPPGDCTRIAVLPGNTFRDMGVPHPDQFGIYAYTDRAPGTGNDTELYKCPLSTIHRLKGESFLRTPLEGIFNFQRILADILSVLIFIFSQIGVLFLRVASYLFEALLGAKRFITNDLVRTGWPFVQGLANIGFIFALLFIAAATTLRIDLGGGIKRLLPRLLLAALLINFSLVIGGLLIDGSRLLMAIILNVMSGGASRMADIGSRLLESSDIVKVAYVFTSSEGSILNIDMKGGQTTWGYVIDSIQAAVYIWGLTVAFIVIAVGLMVRYIMLILLLIVSPLAYLAVAMPGATNFAKLWWTNFLKYAYYGPIAIFILGLLVVVSKTTVGLDVSDSTSEKGLLQAILQLAVVISLIIAAATAGKHLGMIGAAATVGYVAGQGRRLARGTGRGAAWTGKTAAKGAYVLSGTRRGARNVRDYAKEVTRPIRRRFGTGEYSPYDEKGKLKKGRTSAGSRAGSAARRAEIAQTQAAMALPGGLPANLNNPAFNANRLKQGHVIEAMGLNAAARDAQVNVVLRQGSAQQVRAVVQNKDYLRNQDDARIAAMEGEIRANITTGTLDAAEGERILTQLYTSLDEIRNE